MTERKPPIRSTQEDVAELAEEIDRFVIGLAERIDVIQDAELAARSADVAELALVLARDADRLGYPGMAKSAQHVSDCATDDQRDVLLESIVELTEISQRIRQGHRGAA